MDLVYKDRSINESWDGVTLNEWLADGGLPTDGYDPYLDFTSDDDDEDEDDDDQDDEESYIAWRENADGLRWLVDAAVGTMTRWAGIPELRGLYCTRYKPADGIEADCSLPGYTAAECESLQAATYRRIEGPAVWDIAGTPLGEKFKQHLLRESND